MLKTEKKVNLRMKKLYHMVTEVYFYGMCIRIPDYWYSKEHSLGDTSLEYFFERDEFIVSRDLITS